MFYLSGCFAGLIFEICQIVVHDPYFNWYCSAHNVVKEVWILFISALKLHFDVIWKCACRMSILKETDHSWLVDELQFWRAHGLVGLVIKKIFVAVPGSSFGFADCYLKITLQIGMKFDPVFGQKQPFWAIICFKTADLEPKIRCTLQTGSKCPPVKLQWFRFYITTLLFFVSYRQFLLTFTLQNAIPCRILPHSVSLSDALAGIGRARKHSPQTL